MLFRSGATASGVSTIKDDGTGSIYLGGNTTSTPNISTDPGYPAQLDDDRPLAVNSITVNEASPYAVFTVTANKRDQAIEDVAGIVSFVDAETLATNGVNSVRDLANVTTTTRSTFTPMSDAISPSSATARIAFPVRVRETKSESPTTATATTTKTMPWTFVTSRPNGNQLPWSGAGTGNPYVVVPKNPRALFWRKSEAPIAVMSGTRRGALRSGR